MLQRCPYNILSYEVKEFCSNIKANLTQIKKEHTTHFTMAHKNTAIQQTISIETQNINKNGFYTRFLGKIETQDKNYKFENIACDVKFTYDKVNKMYYIYAPEYIERQKIEKRNSIASIDPGEKVFVALYGLDHVCKIGEDIRKPILEYEKTIRIIQRRLSKTTNKRERERLKKAIRRKYKRIKGIVKELHNKTALYLCKNYERILIPKFETQKMISNKTIKDNKKIIKEDSKTKEELQEKLKNYKKKVRLNSRVKFVLNMLSHYKFRQQLLAKAEEYGCEVEEVSEEYTSQCCGKCGRISKKYVKRIKHCPHCKMEIERDYNGSRNIMIKNIERMLRVKPETVL